MKDILVMLLIMAVVIGMMVGAFIYSHHLDSEACAAKGALFGLSTRAFPGVGGSCQFKIPPGVWVDADEWILIKATK